MKQAYHQHRGLDCEGNSGGIMDEMRVKSKRNIGFFEKLGFRFVGDSSVKVKEESPDGEYELVYEKEVLPPSGAGKKKEGYYGAPTIPNSEYDEFDSVVEYLEELGLI